MDYRVHGILQARILGVGSFSLLQGIFPTQGLNPGLPYCRLKNSINEMKNTLDHTGNNQIRWKRELASWKIESGNISDGRGE